jgi:hypothetical protein
MNRFALVMKVLSLVSLIWLISALGVVFDNSIFQIGELSELLGDVRDFASYAVYTVLYSLYGAVLVNLVGVLFNLVPSFDAAFFIYIAYVMFENIVGRWFMFSPVYRAYDEAGLPIGDPIFAEGAIPSMGQAAQSMQYLGLQMVDNLYLTMLQIFAIALFFYAFKGSLNSNPGDNIKTVVFANLIMIIPMFVKGLQDLLLSFGVVIPKIDELVDMNLLSDSIYEGIADSFAEFLAQDIFLIALISFIYLELCFQVAYVDKVTSPSVERETRLKSQIQVLQMESSKAVQSLQALEEARRQKKLEDDRLRAENEQEETEINLKEFTSEGGTRFSYISELIERKKLERMEAKMMEALKDTRRLNNFIQKLFGRDRDAFNSLTAKTSAPGLARLVVSSVVNMVTRMVLVVAFAFACCHPYWFMVNVFNVPPAIANSVEIVTPEAVLSIFVPLILIFPISAEIIKQTKHSKLNEILRLEEIRRSGLSEEELTQIKTRNQSGEVSAEETQFSAETTQAPPATPPSG